MNKKVMHTNLADNVITPDISLLTLDTNEKQELIGGEFGQFVQIRQKYKNQTLMEVYGTGNILHVTLANRLGVSASGLNATLKKLNDADPKPLQEVRAGKFKFYSLTETGKNYVETEILPLVMDSEQDKSEMNNIVNLLSAYKDKNHGKWNENLERLLEEEKTETENEDIDAALGREFFKEYVRFYRRKSEKAENLLNLLIVDKDLKQKVLEYVERKHAKNKETVMDILNQWVEQDCEETYRLMDYFFQSSVSCGQDIESLDTYLPAAEEWLEAVHNRLLADALCALAGGWEKDQLAKKWIQDDMEKSLALYLAEQYRHLRKDILRDKYKN